MKIKTLKRILHDYSVNYERHMPYKRPTVSYLRPRSKYVEHKTWEDYINKVMLCQRQIKKWFARRKRKATIISRHCHDWVWKPVCNDGKIGIRLRLDLKYLEENNIIKM